MKATSKDQNEILHIAQPTFAAAPLALFPPPPVRSVVGGKRIKNKTQLDSGTVIQWDKADR